MVEVNRENTATAPPLASGHKGSESRGADKFNRR